VEEAVAGLAAETLAAAAAAAATAAQAGDEVPPRREAAPRGTGHSAAPRGALAARRSSRRWLAQRPRRQPAPAQARRLCPCFTRPRLRDTQRARWRFNDMLEDTERPQEVAIV
jgi:hypothetical protein